VNYTLPKLTTVYNFRRLLDGVDACTSVWRAPGWGVPARRSGLGCWIGAGLLVGAPGYLWASTLLASGQATLSG
jgi:thiamine-monophosphate kinase